MTLIDAPSWLNGPSYGLPADPRPAEVVQALAARRELWEPLVRFNPEQRVHVRALVAPTWEAWVLTWLPGQGTFIHDHGGSAGAFLVLDGALTEETYGLRTPQAPAVRELGVGRTRAFSARHVHRVTNTRDVPAISLHAYEPAIAFMTTYEVVGERLTSVGVERAGANW
jgi:predicted metal-dependent enzyme (double-stranded beta helix superfamily)